MKSRMLFRVSSRILHKTERSCPDNSCMALRHCPEYIDSDLIQNGRGFRVQSSRSCIGRRRLELVAIVFASDHLLSTGLRARMKALMNFSSTCGPMTATSIP